MAVEVFRKISTTEHISVVFTDSGGTGVTGLSPTLRIRAETGPNAGLYYQAGSGTWGVNPLDDAVMTPDSAANLPGLYHYDFLIPGDANVAYTLRADGTATPVNRYQYGRLFSTRYDLEDLAGSGFMSSTDSLEALHDLLISSGAASSASASDTTHFLGRLVQKVRQIADEPASNAKYTDDDILRYARAAWESVLVDLNNVSDNPLVCRFDLTITAGNSNLVYQLPPTVGEILTMAKHLADDRVEWEVPVRSRWNPSGPGVTIEGNTIRLSPAWTIGSTLRITYIPTGSIEAHRGTTTGFTTTTLTLDSTPTNGSLDSRPNAYAGCILRILNDTGAATQVQQERIISAHNVSTGVVTVSVAFNPALTPAATITYEVVPLLERLLEECVAFYTASTILSIEADEARRVGVERKYGEMLRALRLRLSNVENRVGDRFEHDTHENSRYDGLSGMQWGMGA